MGLLAKTGSALNAAASAVVFAALDFADAVFCVIYKLADFLVDREWKPCYCSPWASGNGAGNVLGLSATANRVYLDSLSDTLHSRPYALSRLASFVSGKRAVRAAPPPTILEIPRGSAKPRAAPRWSDCDCRACNAWADADLSRRSLHVHIEGSASGPAEDVLFVHGFISSSAFWTETVFREFSPAALARYRLLAVDLLGFGRSPKPDDSLYTLREHVELIERSVLRLHGVRRFHIVAHSLGSVLAVALAARHPDSVLSLTLLAPPYFPEREGEEGSGKGVMKRLAPKKVWPPLAFAASMVFWYEHVSRTICLLICRQHRLWDFIFRLLTFNRIRTFLFQVFMCHTHNAAWHTLHNVICGSTEKMSGGLDALRERIECHVSIFHAENDELIPMECSYAVKARVPRAHLNVIPEKDHITMVVGREKAFAAELEVIWKHAKWANTDTLKVQTACFD